jgi:hypothetical protein
MIHNSVGDWDDLTGDIARGRSKMASFSLRDGERDEAFGNSVLVSSASPSKGDKFWVCDDAIGEFGMESRGGCCLSRAGERYCVCDDLIGESGMGFGL